MASDAELVILWETHRHELRVLLSGWNKQQEALLRGITSTTSWSAAAPSRPASMMRSPSSGGKPESRDSAASKSTLLDGNSQSCGNPFSRNQETVSGRSLEAAADPFDAPCGGSTEPASLEIKSVKIYPFSEELRASVHEGGGVAGSEAAADQSDAPCCGGSTEPAPLENKSGKTHPFLEELRAPVPEGGGAADREACHAFQGTEGEGWPAHTDDADNGVCFHDSSVPRYKPGLQTIMVKADEPGVAVELSPSLTFVKSKTFEAICSVVIFCNAVFIAVASDYEIRHLDYRANTFTRCFFVLELVFFFFYLFEVSIRIYALRLSFFRCEDARWNCFDLFLVIYAIFDQGVQLVSSSASGVANLSFIRMMKLVKMVKLMRVFRLMRSFKGLRIVLNGILCSMHTMLYAIFLIVTTTFMFGTALVQSCTIYLQDEEPDAQTSELIYELWGSVPLAMLSLFMAGTSGDSWRVLARPLEKVGFVAYTIFIFYLVFFVFVITNTLISLFVEHSMKFAATDEQLVVQQELEKKEEYVEKVKHFFDLIDTDGSGEISYDEFLLHLSSPILHAFAASLEMDIQDAQEFFHVLSGGGTHKVDVETFVVGCIKLRGNAKSMDMVELMHTYKQTSRQLVWQQQALLQRVDSVDKALRAMSDLVVPLDAHAHAAVGE